MVLSKAWYVLKTRVPYRFERNASASVMSVVSSELSVILPLNYYLVYIFNSVNSFVVFHALSGNEIKFRFKLI